MPEPAGFHSCREHTGQVMECGLRLLQVHHEHPFADGDGGAALNADGSIRGRRCLVLRGSA